MCARRVSACRTTRMTCPPVAFAPAIGRALVAAPAAVALEACLARVRVGPALAVAAVAHLAAVAVGPERLQAATWRALMSWRQLIWRVCLALRL